MPHTSLALPKEAAAFLQGFSQVFASIGHLPLTKQRESLKKLLHIPESSLMPILKVENKKIKGRHGEIPLRIYTPKHDSHLPVIVYLHRGGFVYGSLDEAEMICRQLSNLTESIVVSVEYRLSPEHAFPIPLEDCYDATLFVSRNAEKLIICGESAGGNLAACVALMNRDQKQFNLSGQLLLYPILTSDLNPEYYEMSPDKHLLSLQNMEFFLNAYLQNPQDKETPYAAPLKCQDLSDLPPTFILTAEHDALKHEGEAYHEALQEANIQSVHKCYLDVIHGFLDLPIAKATKKTALQDVKTWIRSVIK